MVSLAQMRMAQGYEDKAKAEAAEKARIDAALGGVKTISKGATTFDQIDQWLSANPDAQYFRIGNDGNTVNKPRSYTFGQKYGQWDDNDAAIVASKADQGARDIFRYTNISAANPRTGKRGEKATISQQYSGGSFFKENNIGYNSSYGMILSRDEYGALKNMAAQKGAGDQFLKAYSQTPKEAPLNVRGAQQAVDTQRGAPDLGGNEEVTTALQSSEDTLTKRTLLG